MRNKTVFFCLVLFTFLVSIDNAMAQTIKKLVTSFELNTIPGTKPNGNNWDPFDGPDVFIKILDDKDEVVFESEVKKDVSKNDFPLVWVSRKPILLFTGRQYIIRIFDKDIAFHDIIEESIPVPIINSKGDGAMEWVSKKNIRVMIVFSDATNLSFE